MAKKNKLWKLISNIIQTPNKKTCKHKSLKLKAATTAEKHTYLNIKIGIIIHCNHCQKTWTDDLIAGCPEAWGENTNLGNCLKEYTTSIDLQDNNYKLIIKDNEGYIHKTIDISFDPTADNYIGNIIGNIITQYRPKTQPTVGPPDWSGLPPEDTKHHEMTNKIKTLEQALTNANLKIATLEHIGKQLYKNQQ